VDFFTNSKSYPFWIKKNLKMITPINWLFLKEKLAVLSVKSEHFISLNKPFFDKNFLFLNDVVKKCRIFAELESES
jgi:hypothetical protein